MAKVKGYDLDTSAHEFPTCVGMNRTRDFIFDEPRDYYENYLDNEFERGHK